MTRPWCAFCRANREFIEGPRLGSGESKKRRAEPFDLESQEAIRKESAGGGWSMRYICMEDKGA